MLDQILATDLVQQANQNAEAIGLFIILGIVVVGLAVLLGQHSATGPRHSESNATTIPPHDPPRRHTVVRTRVTRPR